MGRTEANTRLLSQQQMLESKMALVRAKKSLMSVSTPCSPAPWWSRRATNCANKSQGPGGSSELGPSAQYSAIILCSSVRPALSSSNAWALARYFVDPDLARPVADRNCEAGENAHGG